MHEAHRHGRARDDHTHERHGFGQLVAHPVHERLQSFLGPRRDAARRHMTLKRQATRLDRVGLAPHIVPARGAGMLAPVIEHARDVREASPCPRQRTQREVVILSARHILGGHSDAVDQLPRHAQEMRHTVMAVEQIHVEARLENGLTPCARDLEQVFVAVQDLRRT